VLYSKQTWIPLESGILNLPGRALYLTAGAEAVHLHLFRGLLKKHSNWGVFMAVKRLNGSKISLLSHTNVQLSAQVLLESELKFQVLLINLEQESHSYPTMLDDAQDGDQIRKD